MEQIVIKGNSVYEVDESCLQKKKKKNKKEDKRKGRKK